TFRAAHGPAGRFLWDDQRRPAAETVHHPVHSTSRRGVAHVRRSDPDSTARGAGPGTKKAPVERELQEARAGTGCFSPGKPRVPALSPAVGSSSMASGTAWLGATSPEPLSLACGSFMTSHAGSPSSGNPLCAGSEPR